MPSENDGNTHHTADFTPDTGNQPSFKPTRSCKIIAIQNDGAEIPKIESDIKIRSIIRLWYTAANTPNNNPITIAIMYAAIAITNVYLNACKIKVNTAFRWK